jgi:hypothetical protein
MLGVTYASEIFKDLSFVAGSGQIWALPFMIYLAVVDTSQASRWTIFTVTTLLLSYPNGKLQGSTRLRTLVAGSLTPT